jgi:hypothetical protein
MQNSGQNFKTIDDPQAGEGELGAGVDEVDLASLRGWEGVRHKVGVRRLCEPSYHRSDHRGGFTKRAHLQNSLPDNLRMNG